MTKRPARCAPTWVGAALLLAGCASGGPEASPQPAAPAAPAAAQPPAAGGSGGATPTPTSAASYTAAQAERGRQVFSTVCSSCHAINEFRGQQFQLSWRTLPIGDFYQFISTAMPQDQPGSLRPEQYAAVVAHVLQLNGAPVGTSELPADVSALRGMAWPR